MCESIPAASIPPPGQTPDICCTMSPGGRWQLIVSRPPGHLQTTKNLFRNILSPFPTAFRIKGFKNQALSFWSRWRAFIVVTHFVTCSMQFYWAETVMYIDRIDWGAGHLPTKVARRAGYLNNFLNSRSMPGDLPGGDARGWNWLAHKTDYFIFCVSECRIYSIRCSCCILRWIRTLWRGSCGPSAW